MRNARDREGAMIEEKKEREKEKVKVVTGEAKSVVEKRGWKKGSTARLENLQRSAPGLQGVLAGEGAVVSAKVALCLAAGIVNATDYVTTPNAMPINKALAANNRQQAQRAATRTKQSV